MPTKNEDNLNEQIDDQQVIYFSIGVVLIIIIASIVIYGIGYGQSSQASSYKNKIEAVDQQLSSLESIEETALALGVAQEEINTLYSRQITYSNLISDLSDLGLKNVSLTNVSLDGTDSSLQIQGVARSYRDVNKQVVAYHKSESLDDIQIVSAADDSEGKVQFLISASVQKGKSN